MRVTEAQACQIKASLFGACGKHSVATCQYCGRPFCSRHGVLLDDGQEICSRKECVAKRQDLARHLLYKDAVRVRNEDHACGITACVTEISAQCVRCRGFFCDSHVHKRDEAVLEATVRVRRMATLCKHCSDRREIWVRQ